MRRIWYDFEFLENGSTIFPISVGMVDDQGRELYLVNEDIEGSKIKEKIRNHDFLMGNVIPHLPLRVDLVAMDVGSDGRPSIRHHRGIGL